LGLQRDRTWELYDLLAKMGGLHEAGPEREWPYGWLQGYFCEGERKKGRTYYHTHIGRMMVATQQRVVVWTPLRWILLAIACILFILAAFGVNLGSVNIVDIGLALGFGSFLVP
jgi:hypothetical protein